MPTYYFQHSEIAMLLLLGQKGYSCIYKTKATYIRNA